MPNRSDLGNSCLLFVGCQFFQNRNLHLGLGMRHVVGQERLVTETGDSRGLLFYQSHGAEASSQGHHGGHRMPLGAQAPSPSA